MITPPERSRPPLITRWLVLLLVSLAMFGNYYVYDSISPLADVLKAQLGFSDANIGLLNAIYSLPNIVMALIGGVIIDRIGTKRSVTLFSAMMLVGAGLTTVVGTLPVMATGRLLFGLGAESQIVAVTTAMAHWFKGKELGFAFGLNLTLARLGSFAALNSPTWAATAYAHWQTPLLIATALAVISLVAALLYWVLESRVEARYDLGQANLTEQVAWRDIAYFGTSYWYIVALCITFYSAIFPFQTFAVKFFMDTHGTSREFGGFLSSLLTLFAMFGTPLFGYIVDRTGKRSLYLMLGSALLIPVYLMMAYTHVSLYVPTAMMGIAFSLVPAVLWPAVAYVVEAARLGTAYGLMTLIQNVGLAGFTLLIGWANDRGQASAANPGGYALGMWLFSMLGFFGFLFAWRLRQQETGPNARGLETIKAA
jgi:MFS family permease